MKNIAFIINPIAGTNNKRRLPRDIDNLIDHEQWAIDIIFTEYKGHATELAAQYARLGFDAVVAVGGDGTVNEVATGLRHTNTALGIIPIGSGNGLARHLGYPTRTTNAIQLLNHTEPISVDYGMLGDQPFFCTCGVGFDAHISEEFQKANSRGLHTYIKQIVKDFFGYKPEHYKIITDTETIETDAFLITFANANQWGNAAYIAPKASIQDGQLDVAILSPFPLKAVPNLALRLFEKSIDDTLYMQTIHAKQITLIRETEGACHFDGEPTTLGSEIKISLVPDGLKVLVPKRF